MLPVDTLKVKICGMRDARNVREVSSLRPDHLGLIFYEYSPRFAGGPEVDAFEILLAVEDGVALTGVFVDSKLSFVVEMVDRWTLDAVQLHGTESPEYLSALGRALPKHVQLVKAFSVDDRFDFAETIKFEHADLFLFDAAGKYKGGNGSTFNHDLLQDYKGNKPFWLSGGIGYAEAEDVLQNTAKWPLLYGLDINSRIEISPGVKDVAKAAAIIKFIRLFEP